MDGQLDLSLEVPIEASMPEHVAREVLALYGTLTPKRITDAHRAAYLYRPQLVEADADTFTFAVRLIDEARDSLMRLVVPPLPRGASCGRKRRHRS